MNNMKSIFTILSNGTKVEYNVILKVTNTETNKNYVVYTDNTLDKNNKLRLYAAVYDPKLSNPYIGEPTTKDEWTFISNTINKVIPIK